MDLRLGQLLVILAPNMDFEIFAAVKQFDKDSVMLELKSSTEIPVSKNLLCIVVDEDNVFEFYTSIIAKNGKNIFIKLPDKNEFSVMEKRKFNRVDCRIGFVATPISINNIPLNNSDKKFTGLIKNISGGGVMIETNLNLPPEMIFSFKLKLNFFIECKAKVIRTRALDKDTFESGCQFVECSLENTKTIALYVFKETLKQRRRELNQRK